MRDVDEVVVIKKQRIKIGGESKLHAKTAIAIAQKASEWKSKINIRYKEEIINAKSMTAILNSEIKWNMTIEVIASGEDEAVAVLEFVSFLREYGKQIKEHSEK